MLKSKGIKMIKYKNHLKKITKKIFKIPTIKDPVNIKKKKFLNKFEFRKIKIKKKKIKFLSKIFEHFQSLIIIQSKKKDQKKKE